MAALTERLKWQEFSSKPQNINDTILNSCPPAVDQNELVKERPK
jgi:hypothetical protein